MDAAEFTATLTTDFASREEAAIRSAISLIPRRLWGLVMIETFPPTIGVDPARARDNTQVITMVARPPKVTVRPFADVGPVAYWEQYRRIAALMA